MHHQFRDVVPPGAGPPHCLRGVETAQRAAQIGPMPGANVERLVDSVQQQENSGVGLLHGLPAEHSTGRKGVKAECALFRCWLVPPRLYARWALVTAWSGVRMSATIRPG